MDQVSHSYKVVGSGCEGEYPAHFVQPAVSGLAQHAHGLQPAEDFFDSFSFPLTDFVPGVMRGPAVDRTAAGPLIVLRHMRRYLHLAQCSHKVSGVISFISRDRYTVSARNALRHQQSRIPFRVAAALHQFGIPFGQKNYAAQV